MIERNEIDKSDWVVTDDGICQVVELSDAFCEEFSSESDSVAVGDYIKTFVIYKVFCDYSGKPRKRAFFKWDNLRGCSHLSKKDERQFSLYQKENSEHFQKVLSLTNQKPVKDTYDVWFRVPSENVTSVFKGLEKVANELPNSFNFIDFQTKVNDHGVELDFSKVHYDDFYDEPRNVVIRFLNENFQVKDRRLVFSDFQFGEKK